MAQLKNLNSNNMHLVNMPKVRVQKYSKGWVVERQVKTWYGKKYWIYIKAGAGIESQPQHYKTMDSAVHDAQKHFAWDLYHGHAMFYNTKLKYKNYGIHCKRGLFSVLQF